MKTLLIALFCCGVVIRMAHHAQQYPMRTTQPRVNLLAGGAYRDALAAHQAGVPLIYRGAGRRMVGRGCCHGPNCH